MKKILIVDDEENVRYSFRKFFRTAGYEIIEAVNGLEALSIIGHQQPDLVLMDIEMPIMNGIDAIQRIKQLHPELPVIIITAFGTTERVIGAMKFGAFDYLEKPFDVERLRAIVAEALDIKRISEEDKSIEIRPLFSDIEYQIVGKSSAIKEVYKMIGRVAASDVSVLINGESGTGKELVARAIHKFSDRSNRPFVAINCAALPDTLLESELFGYEKGSFTNATQTKEGKFETAHLGTLFLDEVADMSLALQAKLLRVIQDGTFERLGSNKTLKVDVRFISATNKNLESAIATKSFREDLFYRLKVVSITLPPLRIRSEDIPLLTNYFLARQCDQLKKPMVTLPNETMDALIAHHWPGNVRELENLLKRALLMSKGNVILPSLVKAEMQEAIPARDGEITSLTQSVFPSNLDDYEGRLYHHVIDQIEKDLIRLSLRHTRGNQTKAARTLGISRAMLIERIDKYGLNDIV